jgi:amino acid adenylation domain-containing protein/thioester reductase-like protein
VLRIAEREYLLCLILHHIICDGFSVGVLARELGSVYTALALGEPTPALPPTVSPDVLPTREQAYLGSPEGKQALAWWEETLRDAPETPLPLALRDGGADRPSASYRVRLSAEATTALEQLAARRHASLYSVICAAVAAWVMRCTGEADLVFGVPAANRISAELAGTVALTVNTVALRLRCAGAETFADLVEVSRDSTLASLERQALPFELVVNHLAPDRYIDRNPLFQIMVAHQNVDAPVPQLGDAAVERDTDFSEQVRLDLEVTTWRHESGLELRVGGRGQHYDAAAVYRAATQLRTLLTQAVARPDAPLRHLPVLPEQELALIRRWENGPAATASDTGTLPGLFAATARLHPGRPALESSTGVVTFGELARLADQVTRRLSGLAAGPGDIVGIALERDIPLVAAILGIMGTGAACLPLNLRDPDARRATIVADAGCRLVVTGDGPCAWLPAGVAALPAREPDGEQAAAALGPASGAGPGRPSRARPPSAADVAYVIYTSGTTGRPKGVAVEHRNIVNTLLACVASDGLGEGDLGLVLAAHTFDVFYHELFTPMLSGAASYLVTLQELFDNDAIGALLDRASSLQAVPGLMEQLIQVAAAHGAQCGKAMRRLMTGGDTVPPALLQRMRATFPHAKLAITYGPTETAIFCTRFDVPDDAAVTGHPLGRPLPGATVRVVDEHGERVPIGVEGEIWIGGRGVSRGYLQRPAEQAASFVERDGRRFYRSGDRARWHASGQLEFLGRKDNQVKVRGVRVELGEIEALAASVPGIAHSVVTRVGTSLAEQRLHAYVVPTASAGTDAAGSQLVDGWRQVFDDAYGDRIRHVSGGLDFTGWTSSFTGDPIGLDAMRDWLAGTLRRIRDCLGERTVPRIAEIGCGTGLVLLSLAGEAGRYVGTDLSARAIFDLRARVRAAGLSHVELAAGPAAEALAGTEGQYDLTVLNSVIQYFPGQEYLTEVLDTCLQRIADGGSVFIGDVRDFSRAVSFWDAVGRARGVADASRPAWARAAADREDELLVAPAWFENYARAQPRVTGVEITPRLDHHATEMSRYRYDVVLHTASPAVGVPAAEPAEIPAARLSAGLPGLRSLLRSATGPVVLRSVGTPFAERAADGETGLIASAAQLRDLADELGWYPAFDLSGSEGDFDVLLLPPSLGDATEPARRSGPILGPGWRLPRASTGTLCSDPGRLRRDRELARTVREQLARRLPSYLVPDSVTVLDRFPLTVHDKVDRAALPVPPASTAAEYRLPAPRELPVVAAWGEVLGHQDFTVDDDFFKVGGTSLGAIQLAVALRSRGLVITPQQIFELRTVAKTAERTVADQVPSSAEHDPVVPAAEHRDHARWRPGTRLGARSPLSTAGRVLLTGATGMLGIHVLHALLSRTSAEVTCVIRSGTRESAYARLEDQYGWYFPAAGPAALSGRVRAVAADLRRDDLAVALRAQLPGTVVDHVIHCAADVRHVADRQDVMAVNVGGTRQVIDLVRQLGPVSLHHISTVGVAGWVPRGAAVTVLDEDSLDIGQFPTEPYSESKILAERLVREHFAVGWEGTIMRVGTIAPQSGTGLFQRDMHAHFFSRYIRSVLALGVTATWPDNDLRLVPADLMAAAIVELANAHPGSAHRTFHLAGTEPLSHGHLASMLTSLGYQLTVVAPDNFPAYMDRLIAGGADRALVGGLLPRISRHEGTDVTLDSRRSLAALASLGLPLGAAGPGYVRAFVENGVSRGYFPPPTERGLPQ